MSRLSRSASGFCLPAWLEPRRAELEERLAPLTLHKIAAQESKVSVGVSADSHSDPHAGGKVLQTGAPLVDAAGVVILLHGRGCFGGGHSLGL